MQQKITPFLWFDNQAEEAIRHYSSIFKNARVVNEFRPGGKLLTATFELEGQRFIALNGGPHHTFTEAISLYVSCETQEEVDYYWEKLLAGGGQESRCGWLKDKFGVSWQIIPTALTKALSNPDPIKARKSMDAMLTMKKIVIAELT